MSFRALMRIALCTLLPAAASAHTFAVSEIDHYTELTLGEDRIEIAYGVAISELQAMKGLFDMNQDGDSRISEHEKSTYFGGLSGDILRGVLLYVDGEQVPLVNLRRFELRQPFGMTYRFQSSKPLDWSGKPRKVVFLDTNDQVTPGVDSLLIRTGDGVHMAALVRERRRALFLVSTERISGTAHAAPGDLAREALALAGLSRTGPPLPKDTPSTGHGGSYASARDRIKDLLQGPLTTFIILTSLGLAFFIGALHALQPGHGKTLVAAYLVGSRGTIRHALLLGAIVTFTHTFSVLLLGLIVLFLSDKVLPETVNLWLGVASGILVLVMGLWMLAGAYRLWILGQHGIQVGHGHVHLFGGGHHHHGNVHGHSHGHLHKHAHSHAHVHDHAHGPHHGHGYDQGLSHSHEQGTSHRPRIRLAGAKAEPLSLWNLFTLGIVGGIVPCLDAIVLLLIAVALNRVAFGMLIITVFSLGIATVLVAVGILTVRAKGLLGRFEGGHALLGRLPMVSAVLITLIGAAMLYRSLAGAGILRIGS